MEVAGLTPVGTRRRCDRHSANARRARGNRRKAS
jgi:hypothetical protein